MLPSSSSLSLLLPSLQLQSSALELGAAAKAVGSAMAQLLAAADQGNESYTGKASRETAKALQVRRRRLARNKSCTCTCTLTCTHAHLYTRIRTGMHNNAHMCTRGSVFGREVVGEEDRQLTFVMMLLVNRVFQF